MSPPRKSPPSLYIHPYFLLCAQVRGCLFHFTKAILGKVKKYGLQRCYGAHFGRGNPIYRWVRKICALPLLPKGTVC